MALIKCPECGKEISEYADSCPNCGYKIQDYLKKKSQEEEKRQLEKEREELKKQVEQKKKICIEKRHKQYEKYLGTKRKKAYFLIACLGFLVLIIVGIVGVRYYNQVYIPSTKYSEAKELMEKEQYPEALLIFDTLKNYEKSKEYIKECNYQIAIKEIQDKSKLESVKESFEELGDYKESKKYLKDCYYNLGIKCYEEGHFDEVLKYLVSISEEYDVKKMVDSSILMKSFEGDWVGGYNVEISGWNIKKYDKNGNVFETSIINQDSMQIDLQDICKSSFKDDLGDRYHLMPNATKDLIISFHSDISPTGGSHLEFKKGDFSKVPKEDPQIGMTTEEVLNSTWGEPDDINKDTYSWGVKEQWCYPNNKYIYLEDGIVTSISE